MQILIKKKTKKDFTLSWLFLFLLQCTVSNDCFYKLSLATPRIFREDFFVYIIENSVLKIEKITVKQFALESDTLSSTSKESITSSVSVL